MDLFIDTNISDLEIEVARKAACARGERFEVVPKNYKDYAAYSKKIQDASKLLTKCFEKHMGKNPLGSVPASDCKSEREAQQDAYKKLTEFKQTQISIKEQVKQRMGELSKEKAKLVTVAISGHDGGGHFGERKVIFPVTTWPG